MTMKLPLRPKVLVVDDSVVVRRVLALVLRGLPPFALADIEEAPNGLLALRRLEAERFDLVLSDIRMPAMDGLEMVRRVRLQLKDTTTPIILVSTLGREEDVRRGLDAGASAYICKPIVPTEIRTALVEFLNSYEPPAAS